MLHFNTFIKSTSYFGDVPKSLPDKVHFKNLIQNDKSYDLSYFQVGVTCLLNNANEVVIPANSSFYLTNDESENLFYKIETNRKGMTRQNLATEIIKWLVIRNAHFNLNYHKKNNQDIPQLHHFTDYAENLSVHSIENSGRFRNELPIYNINISS